MSLKYCFYIYHKCDIERILIRKKKFWTSDNIKHQQDCFNTFNFLNVVQHCSLFLGLSVVLMYSLRPFFNENNVFIFDCWIPNDSIVLKVVILFCQYYFLIFLVPVILGYDAMYLCLSVHVIIQTRLLKDKLRRVCQGVEDGGVNKCIVHHQLLLS